MPKKVKKNPLQDQLTQAQKRALFYKLKYKAACAEINKLHLEILRLTEKEKNNGDRTRLGADPTR